MKKIISYQLFVVLLLLFAQCNSDDDGGDRESIDEVVEIDQPAIDDGVEVEEEAEGDSSVDPSDDETIMDPISSEDIDEGVVDVRAPNEFSIEDFSLLSENRASVNIQLRGDPNDESISYDVIINDVLLLADLPIPVLTEEGEDSSSSPGNDIGMIEVEGADGSTITITNLGNPFNLLVVDFERPTLRPEGENTVIVIAENSSEFRRTSSNRRLF